MLLLVWLTLPGLTKWIWLRADARIAVSAHHYLISGYPDPPVDAWTLARVFGFDAEWADEIRFTSTISSTAWRPTHSLVAVIEGRQGIGCEFVEWLSNARDPWGNLFLLEQNVSAPRDNRLSLFSTGPNGDIMIVIDHRRLEAFRHCGTQIRRMTCVPLVVIFSVFLVRRVRHGARSAIVAAMASFVVVSLSAAGTHEFLERLRPFPGAMFSWEFSEVSWPVPLLLPNAVVVCGAAWTCLAMTLYAAAALKEEDPSD